MSPGSNAARIAISGFLLLFCAIGIGLVYGAVVSYQDGEAENALLMLIGGLAFGGFGAGVFAITAAGYRARAREAAVRAAHPDEPWMWREDWAAGRVRNLTGGIAKFLWGFAILWSLLSMPLVIFLPEEIIQKENYAALMGLLFPLIGIGLLVAAVRKSVQQRKYGDCLFLMQSVPGILGGEVSGTLLIPRGLPAAETLSVQLSCIHRRRVRSGKGTSTIEQVLWAADQSVVRLHPAGEGAALGAAVAFRVPYDTKPTGVLDRNNSIIWKLEAGASVPGVDFGAAFEIPVFMTSASSAQLTEERIRQEEVSAGLPAVDAFGGHAGITVVPSAEGGTEFILRPEGGMPGTLPAVGLVLLLGGITVLLTYAGAPFLFPLVFGAFTLFLVLAYVFGAFGESRIVIERGNLSVRNMLFGIVTGRRMPCASITKISVTGQATGDRRGHYSITFSQAGGKTVSPFQFLRQRRQADWLAEELRKAMEPWRGVDRPLAVRNDPGTGSQGGVFEGP